MQRLAGVALWGLLAVVGSVAWGVVAEKLDVQALFVITGSSPQRPFRRPVELAVDERRRVMYVADAEAGAVFALSLQGVGGAVLTAGEKFQPISLAVRPEGTLLVLDGADGKVRAFAASGQEPQELPLTGIDKLETTKLTRLALDRDGRLYVVDQGNCRVLVFGDDGGLRLQFGEMGTRQGQFKVPEDVAVDRFGRVYVTDSLGTPIQVFSEGGKYLYSIGHHGEALDDLQYPTSLTVDRFDQLWLVDTNAHQVIVYDRMGAPLRRFGEFGQMRGQFFYPADMALDGLGRIYTAERGTRRAQVLSYPDSVDRFTR